MRRRARTRVPRTVPPGQLRRTLEAIRRLRTNFVFGTLLVLFLVLLGRLAKLQIVDADHYRTLADKAHLGRYEFAAQRGRILDRFGRVLAQSRPLRRVAVDPHPKVIADPTAFSMRVARLLEHQPPAREIRALIEAEQRLFAAGKKGRRYIVVRSNIEDALLIDRLDTVRAMSNRAKQRRHVYGLIVERGEVREYPNDRHAYHVLGKIPPSDAAPRFGVEGHFHGHLSGRNQRVQVLKDRRGRLMALSGDAAGARYRGGDLAITLDIVVQHFLEDALDEVLKEWQPSELCGIVMDPHTGEVLAWANRPTRGGNLDDEGAGRFHGGFDYVGGGFYEVGSIFKPITVAWALDKGVVRSDEILPMPIRRHFPGCRKPINDTHYVGDGTVVLLIEQSSNTGAAELARRLGPKGMQAMWDHLQLTERPQIEFPFAKAGYVNPEARKFRKWPAWLYHRVAYGQGNTLTPLQFASLFCALARDDAHTVKPSILYRKKSRDPRGPRLCDPKYLPVIRQGLRQVVTQGTARKYAANAAYPIAGKTGTSQQVTVNICSFVGMAPAHDPQMVCLVMAKVPRNKKGSGGAVAAPAVASVLDATLDYIRVPKNRPVLGAPAPAREAPSVPQRGGIVYSPAGGGR